MDRKTCGGTGEEHMIIILWDPEPKDVKDDWCDVLLLEEF